MAVGGVVRYGGCEMVGGRTVTQLQLVSVLIDACHRIYPMRECTYQPHTLPPHKSHISPPIARMYHYTPLLCIFLSIVSTMLFSSFTPSLIYHHIYTPLYHSLLHYTPCIS